MIARATAPTSYYFNDGFEIVEKKSLAQGVTDICTQAAITPAEIDAAFFGLPGYGEASGDIEALDAVPAGVLGHRRYSCDNDMVCGWAGSLAGEDGINVISGTGSMTYGEREGVGHRVGGWGGELFGDEGSAYWIAEQGLNAFSRMSDGRLAKGPLHKLMKERLQVVGDLDVVSLVIDTWKGNRSKIAALATTVCEAAETGDEASARILSAAVDELVILIETTRTLVGFTDQETVPRVVLRRHVLQRGFRAQFVAAVKGASASYDLRNPPRLDPAIGGALYAAKHSGHPLSPDAVQHLSDTNPTR